MYKKFFMGIAAMAALTLVSCSSDDLNSLSDNSSKNEAISFDGYLGRSAVSVNGSRASELKIDGLKEATGGFGVFGNYKEDDGQEFGSGLFNNQKVTYKASAWTYTPLKFWPEQGHIDFLAYAPYDANTVLTDSKSKISFTVEKEIANQKDLLWANAVNQTKDNISSTGKKVKFHFYHALSRLGYSVKLYGDYTSNNVKFTLKEITLAGSSDDKTKGAFYTSGTIDLSKGNKDEGIWSDQAGQQKFDWFSGEYLVNSSTASHPDGNREKDKDYLFVIPQDFSQDGNTLYVIVKYTITYTDGGAQTITNTVCKKLTTNFKQGKAYMLNLTIGLPIEFDVDVVEGWGTDENINIGSNDNNPWER